MLPLAMWVRGEFKWSFFSSYGCWLTPHLALVTRTRSDGGRFKSSKPCLEFSCAVFPGEFRLWHIAVKLWTFPNLDTIKRRPRLLTTSWKKNQGALWGQDLKTLLITLKCPLVSLYRNSCHRKPSYFIASFHRDYIRLYDVLRVVESRRKRMEILILPEPQFQCWKTGLPDLRLKWRGVLSFCLSSVPTSEPAPHILPEAAVLCPPMHPHSCPPVILGRHQGANPQSQRSLGWKGPLKIFWCRGLDQNLSPRKAEELITL